MLVESWDMIRKRESWEMFLESWDMIRERKEEKQNMGNDPWIIENDPKKRGSWEMILESWEMIRENTKYYVLITKY